jgi:hypothetical protein
MRFRGALCAATLLAVPVTASAQAIDGVYTDRRGTDQIQAASCTTLGGGADVGMVVEVPSDSGAL